MLPGEIALKNNHYYYDVIISFIICVKTLCTSVSISMIRLLCPHDI